MKNCHYQSPAHDPVDAAAACREFWPKHIKGVQIASPIKRNSVEKKRLVYPLQQSHQCADRGMVAFDKLGSFCQTRADKKLGCPTIRGPQESSPDNRQRESQKDRERVHAQVHRATKRAKSGEQKDSVRRRCCDEEQHQGGTAKLRCVEVRNRCRQAIRGKIKE